MLFPGTLGTHSEFEVGIIFQDMRLIRKLVNITANGDGAVSRQCFSIRTFQILLFGSDLRRHSVLCVTDTFDFACEGVSPVRGPFFFAALACFELAAERAFYAGHLNSCNLF